MRTLEERVEINANNKNDKLFVEKIIKRLPYDLVDGDFHLMAVKLKSGVRLCPKDKEDKISAVEIPPKKIYKDNRINGPVLYCSFDGAPPYINFYNDGGYLISIHTEYIDEGK